MGLFDKIFRPKEAEAADKVSTYFRTLTAYTPAFTSWQGSIYEMELTRSAIHAVANHVSKLKPEVVGSAKPGLKGAIAIEPNPWMNTAQFLYRAATILYMDTTAFIVPLTDQTGLTVTGYYPLLPQRTEIVEVAGEPWLRYQFANGKRAAIEFSRVGILTRFQYADDFWGSGNKALSPTLDLLTIQREGMEDAVKSAATIRFMARLGQTLRPEDIKKQRDQFAEDNLAADNKTGVMMFDAKYADVKQIISRPWLIDAEQMKAIKDNVYGYFGVNEAILQNSYDENAWNAFYEGAVEPIALQLGLEMTRMTYSRQERSRGNEIMFSSNRLQYASNSTKVSVAQQLVDRGLMSNWQAAELFNLPKPPGEERWLIRGEYIDAKNLPTHTVGGVASDDQVPAAAILGPLVADARDSLRRRLEADEKRGRSLEETKAWALGKLAPLAEAHRAAGLEFDMLPFIVAVIGPDTGVPA